ncbi:MAG: glycosyltransferase [Candidatus Schekmanbacteria bacterium]|nr:glycosyltransferase [Candidatus Schekmanbacteria bacterium]
MSDESRLQVAVLSKSDASGGGASRVAADLTRLLRDAGHEAHHYLAWSGSHRHYQMSLYGKGLKDRLLRRVHRTTQMFGLQELIPVEYALMAASGRIGAYDVLHFHDLSSAISPLTVSWAARRLPTVWTFHDCSPFTGGCLYPRECLRYAQRCGSCPQRGSWPLTGMLDSTSHFSRVKRAAARAGNYAAVAPCRWMAETAFSSGMFAVPPRVVAYGIDAKVFHPCERQCVRDLLCLPRHRFIVLVAAGAFEERKGHHYALQALQAVRDLQPFVLLVGRAPEERDSYWRDQMEGLDFHATGYLRDEVALAAYYAAADLFLLCSLEDNAPLVLLETMAAGTPTVAFATGGIPELVAHEQTGLVVPKRDVAGLVDGIRRAAQPETAAAWAAAARQRIEEQFTYERFLANHLALYRELVATRQRTKEA